MAKKKIPIDYLVKTEDGLDLLIETESYSIEKETTAMLQSYIQKFVEEQVNKQADKNESSDDETTADDEIHKDGDKGETN